MTNATHWQDEAERLRAELSVAKARAEYYMAERNAARLRLPVPLLPRSAYQASSDPSQLKWVEFSSHQMG